MKLEVKGFNFFDKADNKFEILDEKRIEKFEIENDIKLPQNYKEFLISLGYGNCPSFNSIYLKYSDSTLEIDSIIEFSSIENYRELSDEFNIPKEFIPIASTWGGQQALYISASEEYGYGCIYDSDEIEWTSNLEVGFHKNGNGYNNKPIYITKMYSLTKEFENFEEFINSFLTIEEFHDSY